MDFIVAQSGTQLIEIDDMRAFVEVAGSGGFTRAAQQLGIAKSIVSRRVAKMEKDLGVQLLRRTTRGVTLTDAGIDFRIRCERIVAEFDEATDAVAAHRSEIVGRLRIAAPNSFANLLTPTLVEMGQQHPKLEIDTSFTDRIVDLVAERFDVAIRVGRLPDSTMIARRIASVHSVAVASPEYLERAGHPMTPAELVNHTCMIYATASGDDWKFKLGNRWTQVHVNGRFRSDNGETLIQWAIAGLGIFNAPDILVEERIAGGKLVRLFENYASPEYGMFAVRPSGANPPARVRLLIDLLIERFGRA